MSKNDYIKNITNAERRFNTNPVTIQKRSGEDENQPVIVEGYAAKFNQITIIGEWFREEILPGAFDGVLMDDVRCLKNHNPSLLLARSNKGKGTLTLSVDEIGLHYSFAIPNRSVGRDLEDELSTGDLSQSSFSFVADEVVWIEKEGELDLRQILKMKLLYDVSPVTYPAYQDTTIGKRTFDNHVADIDVATAKKLDKNKRVFDVFDAQIQLNKNKIK